MLYRFFRRCYTTRYTRTHEWVNIHNNIATIGITDYTLPKVGCIGYLIYDKHVDDEILDNHVIIQLESSKTVILVKTPISGKILSFNRVIEDEHSLIYRFPEGWIYTVEVDNNKLEDELEKNTIDKDEYNDYVKMLKKIK